MEDFATKEQKGIKEKSIYILHLDTPRIIILTSVIIGLVIIAALIGMNINKQDQKDNESFAHDNTVLENLTGDNSEKPNTMDSNIDSPLNSENILKNKTNDNSIITADNSLKPKDILPNSQGTNNSITNTTSNEPASDILTHENIETTIIPPAHVMKKSDHKKSAKKSNEKSADKNKENTKRKGIVEVSLKDKSLKAAEKEKNYFSIQVAAFDKKSKALSEINNLENKKYNAYVDSAKVNGKTFYKVMIGPIYSKQKAVDLLDEISANKRYEESYIIKR